MFPDKIFYEPGITDYALGCELREKYKNCEWIPIENHNNIPALRQNENAQFAKMKRYLVVGTRKTHKYVENHKVSDFLVPYTSSGCSAMCLYCYLVCNYNKCSYLRLFVNREQMMERLLATAAKSAPETTFEIGSNSDLVLENTITGNLEWTIPEFARSKKGLITFPTKFDAVDSLLHLEHRGKIIFRMSLNPEEIIKKIELGTSPLLKRIGALNKMCAAGYRVGILIAPVILTENFKSLYSEFFSVLAEQLSEQVKKSAVIEVIFMTYSYVHRAINTDAFPLLPDLYDRERMTGRGRGKYCYRDAVRSEAEAFLREEIDGKLGMPVLYVV